MNRLSAVSLAPTLERVTESRPEEKHYVDKSMPGFFDVFALEIYLLLLQHAAVTARRIVYLRLNLHVYYT